MNKVHCFSLNPGMRGEYLMCVFLPRIPELGGSISSNAFMGDCSSHVFSLMYLVDEFFRKEMRM